MQQISSSLIVIVLSEISVSKEKVFFQIQAFLLQKSASFMQIVEICEAPKETVNDYLNELIDKNHIIIKPKRKQGIDKYALTEKGKDVITLLLEKQKIKIQIDKMAPETFQQFKKFLDFIAKSKKGDQFILTHTESTRAEKTVYKNLGTTVSSKT